MIDEENNTVEDLSFCKDIYKVNRTEGEDLFNVVDFVVENRWKVEHLHRINTLPSSDCKLYKEGTMNAVHLSTCWALADDQTDGSDLHRQLTNLYWSVQLRMAEMALDKLSYDGKQNKVGLIVLVYALIVFF